MVEGVGYIPTYLPKLYLMPTAYILTHTYICMLK